MSLPVDIAGSLWFMPTAVWEWEPERAPNSAIAGGEAAASCASGDSPALPPAMRLVFKGYTNDAVAHWFAADSALSRPWNHDEADDARHRHVAKPVPPDTPRADDDATPR